MLAKSMITEKRTILYLPEKKTNISITVTSKHKKVNIIYKLAQRSAKQLVTNSVYKMKHIGNKSELK